MCRADSAHSACILVRLIRRLYTTFVFAIAARALRLLRPEHIPHLFAGSDTLLFMCWDWTGKGKPRLDGLTVSQVSSALLDTALGEFTSCCGIGHSGFIWQLRSISSFHSLHSTRMICMRWLPVRIQAHFCRNWQFTG